MDKNEIEKMINEYEEKINEYDKKISNLKIRYVKDVLKNNN